MCIYIYNNIHTYVITYLFNDNENPSEEKRCSLPASVAMPGHHPWQGSQGSEKASVQAVQVSFVGANK